MYIAAVNDMLEVIVLAKDGKLGSTGICMQTGVTQGQLGKVLAKYLKEHPEDLHQSAALLGMDSLMEAFPCPQGE